MSRRDCETYVFDSFNIEVIIKGESESSRIAGGLLLTCYLEVFRFSVFSQLPSSSLSVLPVSTRR